MPLSASALFFFSKHHEKVNADWLSLCIWHLQGLSHCIWNQGHKRVRRVLSSLWDVREEGHGEGAGPNTASLLSPPPKGKPHCWMATRPGHTRHILTRSPGLSAAPWNVPRPQHRWCSMAVAAADGTPGSKWNQGLVSWHGLPGTHFQ